MTLATAILFIAIGFTTVDPGVVGPPVLQSDSTGSTPARAQQAPSDQTAPESTPPSSAKPPSQTPAKKPKVGTGKKTRNTKKVAPAVTTTTCDPVPANGSSAGSSVEPAPQPGSTPEPSTPEPAKNCPPPKKIVRQGGITEQSIQLAVGSSDEAPKKRGDANQFLKETEDNLKKVSGRQLSSTEQSSVSQIREFVAQSKTAAHDGDLERADTLAKKAKILSDDLVNPKK